MDKERASIGKTWAICDHFELSTGQPVRLNVLKDATGHGRKQFRKWVREGRLLEHRTKNPTSGQEFVGYTRPKVEGREAHAEEVNARSSAKDEKINTSAG
jgi:hypothetical protein